MAHDTKIMKQKAVLCFQGTCTAPDKTVRLGFDILDFFTISCLECIWAALFM